MSTASPISARNQRQVASDTVPTPVPFHKSIPPERQLELHQASLGIRARMLSLTLGTLLIVSGITVALIAALTATAALAPFGLIGGGIALLRFGGRRPDRGG